MNDNIRDRIQQALREEADTYNPRIAFYAQSPGQLLDHVHHRVARVAAHAVKDHIPEEFGGLWAVQVQVEERTMDYSGTRQVPTFYLQENVQGFTDELGAIKVAREIIDPSGYIRRHGQILHITAVKLT